MIINKNYIESFSLIPSMKIPESAITQDNDTLLFGSTEIGTILDGNVIYYRPYMVHEDKLIIMPKLNISLKSGMEINYPIEKLLTIPNDKFSSLEPHLTKMINESIQEFLDEYIIKDVINKALRNYAENN